MKDDFLTLLQMDLHSNKLQKQWQTKNKRKKTQNLSPFAFFCATASTQTAAAVEGEKRNASPLRFFFFQAQKVKLFFSKNKEK